MTARPIEPEKFRKTVLLALAIGISLVFLWMIRAFLTTLLLAAILSGMFHPLYQALRRWFRGRPTPASLVTVAIVLLILIVPLTSILGIVAAQAVQLSQEVRPWVEEQVSRTGQFDRLAERFPVLDVLTPYQDQILSKIGELAGRIGSFVVNVLTAAARGTAVFFFLLFVMLYAMFFFLIDGRATLDKILYYLPLPPEDEDRMVGKFVSVSRATIKGTLVIGVLQGALAGGAFWVAGIEGAAFWGTVMAVLSVIPGLGTALVWVPAVIYLLVVDRVLAGVGLFIWCAGLVGTVDNFLRPWLVGRDTKMPDLLILLSTLGGIALFGAIGVIIGPIVAALFVTVWDLYGTAFADLLPKASAPAGGAPPPPRSPPPAPPKSKPPKQVG